MKTPLTHPRTKQLLANYLSKPGHGLLLTGEDGVGKTFLAQWVGSELHKDTLVISPELDRQGISIEQVRSLYNVTQTGGNLAVILEHADTMNEAAQNAFLKLLEEPPENIVFILTAKSARSILPTIASRAQRIEIVSPPIQDLQEHTKNHSNSKALLHTSEGKPGILFPLLENSEQREAHEATVAEVKQFYTASVYERHVYCISTNFDKEKLQSLLDTLAIIIQTLLQNAHSDSSIRKKLITQASVVEQTAICILEQNGNPKIHMARLCQTL